MDKDNPGSPAKAAASKLPAPSSKRGLKGFFSETERELKKVNWPSAKETTKLTGVVLTVCIGQALLLIAMGIVFEKFVNVLMGSN